MQIEDKETNFKEQFEKQYLEKYREKFEIPKSVEEFLYEEFFPKFEFNSSIRLMDGGGGTCTCGAWHCGPSTIAIGLNTENYTSDRERFLNNDFYTYPCDKCGQPFLYASPVYIDIDKKIVVARYVNNFDILKKDGYKFYKVKEKTGDLEEYIKIILNDKISI